MWSGSGPEPALFLHCMLAHARSLVPVASALAEQVTATLMDLPGHGQSPDWDRARDYGDMCLELAQHSLETPQHVIGHSFGGYVALRLAVEFPHLVKSLTLTEPVFFAVAQHYAPEVFEAHIDRASPAFEALSAGKLARAAELFTNEWGDGRKWDSLPPSVQGYCAERMPMVGATQGALLDDNAGVFDRLGGVEVPVLILAGGESPPVIEAICDGLVAKLPHATKVTLEGAGHMAPLTHPPEVSAHIKVMVVS